MCYNYNGERDESGFKDMEKYVFFRGKVIDKWYDFD